MVVNLAASRLFSLPSQIAIFSKAMCYLYTHNLNV